MPRISAPEREDGYTVIELMIVVMIMLVIVGAIVGIFESVQKSEAFSADRAEALDKLRLAMQRVTRDIRQAESVYSASTASRLEMDTYVLGARTHVVYEVSGTNLMRTVGSQTAVVMQDGLAASDIFGYQPAAPAATQVVKIRMQVHPKRLPETTLVHESEVKLRNFGKASP